MAPVQSRLIVAGVSVPLATVAVILSLVWLKRYRRGGHPPIGTQTPVHSGSLPEPVEPPKEQELCKQLELPPQQLLLEETLSKVSLRDAVQTEELDESDESEDSSAQDIPCAPENKGFSKTSDSGVSSEPELETVDFFCESFFSEIEEESTVRGNCVPCDHLEEEEVVSPEKPLLPDSLGQVNPELGLDIDPDPFISNQDFQLASLILEDTTTGVKEPKQTEVSKVIKKEIISEVAEICKEGEPCSLKESNKKVKLVEGKESDQPRTKPEEEMEKTELAEKLANLELDTMKLSQSKESGERDSANHSPSEVMLASPSISNFSDAHSEGSSDSGKGHSDVATSPSRTPAGGSSVAGDLIPTIYEFVIPQIIVGRLIGRHGSFLQEIMTATHTNIFIKKHPESTKLKICAIEGIQQDIDKALEMIRQKFPLRRYPKLTLERVSFVNLEQAQLRPEDFHLQLIEGVNNDVVLSSLIMAGHFFVQQPSHPSYTCLTNLTQAMTQQYSSPEAPVLTTPIKDAVCVAPSMGGWYRVQIINVDEENSQCEIKFVDYGGYMTVDTSCLKQIRADFLLLPFQAVECCLANIVPTDDDGWSEEARIFVHNLTFGRVLQAFVCSYTDDGIPLVNLYTCFGPQVVLVNNELVAHGYACLIEPEEEK